MTGRPGDDVAALYTVMAERELHGVSPLYEALCLGVAGDERVCALLEALPGVKRQPNLLLAAVRFHGGPVDAYAAFRTWLLEHWAVVSATIRTRRTQTNEAGRCAVLLPALAAASGPLALLELGASAGLCLLPDHYSYGYSRAGRDLPVLGEGEVLLRCSVDGPAPLPERLPDVRWRAGIDLAPPDLSSAADVRWLEALVWPEHEDRLRTLRAALDVARARPPQVTAGDLRTELDALAARAPHDATLVVYHSAVLVYLERGDRAAVADRIRAIAARRPTAWLSNEAPGVVEGTELARRDRRFVLARDGVPLALADPHGRSLHWAPAG